MLTTCRVLYDYTVVNNSLKTLPWDLGIPKN